MATALREFVENSGSGKLRVDREKGIIYDVKILGLTSKNHRSYDGTGTRNSAPLYEGIPVNVNHGDQGAAATRGYEDRIGVVHNIKFNDGLRADFHFNPKHALAEQLIWDAENAPRNVGFSPVHFGKQRSLPGGKVLVESIYKVVSVDLVSTPATTSGLYESDETQLTEDETMSLDLSKLTAGEIPAALKAEILREHVESEGQKAKETELAALREQVEKLTNQQKQHERKTKVDAALIEAKLPESLLTDLFREDCYAADDARLVKLIEDRQAIAKGAKIPPVKVKSREQGDDPLSESFTEVETDVKGRVKSLRAA